ncbi:WS/DGAT/MGAT family acyltransferase [Zhongshania antarctica]|uniref:diacylglycerol O-acyltransferase n=1 Tax=Zhongshania antarctica TaxID=641702 RepID=A0A840R192_9GAMM|nr:wax ester/triacylglycerol synthase family O-acyltransferase [Zhongshania antarctica]MBB5186334.1 WS/DGAT/MGAT family acyltransferase [Zhongshania antarctica]
MQQLNGLDALFAHNERQHAPMHIAALMVYTPQTTKHKKFRLQEVRNTIEQRLSVSPVFRRRLLTVAYNLDQPYWLEDETFNLDNHIHSHELTAKNNEADFHTLIATLHAQPMDMGRPLWEAHVIHGLGRLANYSKGSFGIYMKVHHAALDGVSGTDILAALHGIEPLAFKPSALTDTWAGEAPPSQWAVSRNAYRNNLRKPLQLYRQARQLLPKLRREIQEPPSDHTPGVSWQKSPFNTRIDAQRQVFVVRFDFSRLRAIRRAYPRTTVNHVILCIVGGALRNYLIQRNALPNNPLASLVPVNVRGKDLDTCGNAISMLISNLRTDIEDPLQRLVAVRDAATSAKKRNDSIGRSSLSNIFRVLPSSLEAAALRTLSALAYWPGGIPLPACTFVSNVPGPPIPLYFNDAKLVDMLGLGLIMDHVGLFHVAMSYNGVLSLSVLSSPKTLQDPALYRCCLEASFSALDHAMQRQANKT